MTRTYQKKKRAEREAETRRRIVEATVALHTSVGPARTTISAIADRAGVQRHTVYSHFPDEETLFAACTSHWAALHPFPQAERREAAADPLDRLAHVLRGVWAWYAEVEPDLELFLRDAGLLPYVRRDMTRYEQRLAAVADRSAADLGGSRTVRAAVGHALAFETWRSLVRREGLSTADAVDAMLALVGRYRSDAQGSSAETSTRP
jgi:AcrR family transcriptional regulator